MTKDERTLYAVIEEFLNNCDTCIDTKRNGVPCTWYSRINRALDAVYREKSQIPAAQRVGRPPKEERHEQRPCFSLLLIGLLDRDDADEQRADR